MSYSAFTSSNFRPPLHFYEIRGAEETPETIATKFNIDVANLEKENPGIEFKTGQIVVIDQRFS